MMPEWGSNQEGLKDRAEVWDRPIPFRLPQPYRGFFEINGPLIGTKRHHMTPNKLSLGYTQERLISDERYEGLGGRFPSEDMGIQGRIRINEVYGFYILWGLRWIEHEGPYIPFGHAKVFPVQPRVEMKNIKAHTGMEVIKAGYDVKVIDNP